MVESTNDGWRLKLGYFSDVLIEVSVIFPHAEPRFRGATWRNIAFTSSAQTAIFRSQFRWNCVDDDAAMEQAKKLAESHAVELWQRDRKIATLDQKLKI